jgi:hypothetical protein
VRDRHEVLLPRFWELTPRAGQLTYSVITKRLHADDLRDFILRELDRVGLPHNTFSRPAVDLVVRSADGDLR